MLPSHTASSNSSSSPLQILPSLDKAKTTAPVLAPKINRPVPMPHAIDAWHRLQRVEHVDVAHVEGSSVDQTIYSVSIYLHHHQNRIPTNNLRVSDSISRLTSSVSAAPDLQVLRSFVDLESLRQSVWTTVRQYHPVYCELCDGLAVHMCTTLSQPKLLTVTLDRSRTKRAKKMRGFVRHILAALHEKKALCVPACKAQSELPIVLHGFLFGDEGELAASAWETVD